MEEDQDEDYFWKFEYKVFHFSRGGARRQVALGCARSISADDDLESMFHYFAVGGRKDPLQLSPKETKTEVNFENTKTYLVKKTRLKLLRTYTRKAILAAEKE